MVAAIANVAATFFEIFLDHFIRIFRDFDLIPFQIKVSSL